MKLQASKILTDENISPKVVAFLRQAGVDVRDVKEEEWFGTADEALLDLAYQEERFVLTHDADFGALAAHQGKPCYGILYLRLKNINPLTPTIRRQPGQSWPLFPANLSRMKESSGNKAAALFIDLGWNWAFLQDYRVLFSAP